MFDLEKWELASYIVTVFGFPFAILVVVWDQKRERQNEEEEIYQKLSDEYSELQKLLLANSDLQLFSKGKLNEKEMTVEQQERKLIIFDLLISLFERAYILVYEENMSAQQRRLWASWDDYIREWCARPDFRATLPNLLRGEDPDFVAYMSKISKQVGETPGHIVPTPTP